MMKTYFLILFGIVLGGCTAPKQNSNRMDLKIHDLAYSSLNVNPVSFSYNENKDYVLGVYKDNKAVGEHTVLKYVVIDVKSESVVEKGSVNKGEVNWISDYEIQIIDPPGIMKSPSETLAGYTSILNVKTGKKTDRGTALK